MVQSNLDDSRTLPTIPGPQNSRAKEPADAISEIFNIAVRYIQALDHAFKITGDVKYVNQLQVFINIVNDWCLDSVSFLVSAQDRIALAEQSYPLPK